MPAPNIYTPQAYAGVVQGQQTTDVDFSYPYDVTLTANQFLRDQALAIQNDADFAWRAVILATYTGAFTFRFTDSSGYYLSNAQLNYANLLPGGLPLPWPIFPEIIIPAGGRIGIDIQDLSGSTNAIELVFRGAKRYTLPAQSYSGTLAQTSAST